MTTELVKQESLPEKTNQLTNTQIGWLKFESIKRRTFADLQNGELIVQSFLLKLVEDKDLASVQEKIKQAKAQAAENKEQRLYFTSMIQEKIISPAMEFEKRNEALIATAVAYELTLRKTVAQQQTEQQRKDKELGLLKAHIENEHYRIAAKYRTDLLTLVTDGYKNALQGRIPIEQIPAYKDGIRKFMCEQKLDAFVVFQRTLVTQEEAVKLFGEIRKYNPKDDLNAYLAKVDETFAMYEQDLQNAEAAVKQMQQQTEEQVAHEKQQLEQTVAVNTIANTAGISNIVPAKLAVVRKQQVVVEENTDEWALAVLRGFISNWTDCKKYVKVKTFAKLTIGQMADAVGKLYSDGTQASFPGLTFKEVEK